MTPDSPILAIESSCDETAVAVLRPPGTILSSLIASQAEEHARFGGVVPEVASRNHLLAVDPLVRRALSEAGITARDLGAVAATSGPGLAPALLVGASYAKGYALALGIPYLALNHLEGHLLSPFLGAEEIPAHVALLVSGGHTQLTLVRSAGDYTVMGRTLDDAAGEAFDKAATVLGLGYPGGPQIEAAAVGGNPRAHRLPRPLANDHDRLDLSFSGLKTALRYLVRPPGSPADTPVPQGKALADLAASFQQAAVDSILAKVALAIDRTGCRVLAIGGGVTANTLLRESVERLGRDRGIDVLIPPRSLCTDNAAMGAIAWERLERGENDGLELDVLPGTDRSAARRR